jgi:hypothetical protein
LTIFEQPERIRVFTFFNLYIFLGSLARLEQSFKFMRRRFSRSPMDECILDKLGQSFIMSFSRFGNFVKSGVLCKCLE